MLVAVLVNPDAGLGGVLAYKGSDGLADEARKAGAEERRSSDQTHPCSILCD